MLSALVHFACLRVVIAYSGDELKSAFDGFRAVSDTLYSKEEEIQHYERFKDDVKIDSNLRRLPPVQLEKIFNSSKPALLQAVVEEINSKQNSWVASKGQSRFRGASHGDLMALYGKNNMPTRQPMQSKNNSSLSTDLFLPSSFDARVLFEECADTIGHVRDQANCGSCVAHAVVGVFNDRLCIRTRGKFKKLLSPAYAMACCTPESGCTDAFGCNGAVSTDIWSFAQRYGIPTGGDYKKKSAKASGCWPYDFPKCNHLHKEEGKYPPCDKSVATTPQCLSTCPNAKYKTKLSDDLHFVDAPGEIPVLPTVRDIQAEIYKNGPVTAGFQVYEDFAYYKSGVYEYMTGKPLFYHVVKLIGWGKTDTKDYWLAVNSWNEEWGEKGLFRIAFGQCGMEKDVTCGHPKV